MKCLNLIKFKNRSRFSLVSLLIYLPANSGKVWKKEKNFGNISSLHRESLSNILYAIIQGSSNIFPFNYFKTVF